MIRVIKNFLRGRVTFTVQGGNFLLLNRLRKFSPANICINEGDSFRFTVPFLHAHQVKIILSKEKYSCTEHKNIFILLNFFYIRLALTTAAVICFCTLMFLNNFIFAIKVNGIEGEEKSHIANYLNATGIKTLTLKSMDKAEKIALEIVKNFDFVAHASAEIMGNTLIFHIYKVEVAKDIGENIDLIARFNAVVTEVIVVSGIAQVEVGDVVKEGDILIKGEYKTGEEATQRTRAVGIVRGDVKYAKSQVLFDTMQIMTPTGATKTSTDVFVEPFGDKRNREDVGFTYYETSEEYVSFTLFFKVVRVKTTYHELKQVTQKVDLNKYKNIVATGLLAKIKLECGTENFDKVDNFFTPLGLGSIAVEVVGSVNTSLGSYRLA